MDQLARLKLKVQQQIWMLLLVRYAIVFVAGLVLVKYTHLGTETILGICLGISLVISALAVNRITKYTLKPLEMLRQAILHISPLENTPVAAPNLDDLKLGHELIANLIGQVHEINWVAEHELLTSKKEVSSLDHNFIANSLPLPLFILNNNDEIIFTNQSAVKYIGIDENEMLKKNIYMVLDMAFPSNDTFDHWLKEAKQKSATSSKSWERIRLNVRENHPTLLFDLSAYYNKDNPDDTTTILVLFDHTKQYSQDEQAVSFIALSVHELRTPLTLLRGYVEVFEQEIKGKISPELDDFMNKMKATSEQLTSFVNNILNVARVDDDQLELKLQEEDWAKVLNKAISNIELRAKVRGISIECSIEANLPKVGVDRLSIQEVLNNLIDNAIKYSAKSKTIKITSEVNRDGFIETNIQDFGLGIPASITPNLFTKFYRDHRNRAQIGGTGLGLYLSKAIVTAHGGNIWVKSTDGEGSTFGFTIQPFDKLSQDAKKQGDGELIRNAHGWIKNHSYIRR